MISQVNSNPEEPKKDTKTRGIEFTQISEFAGEKNINQDISIVQNDDQNKSSKGERHLDTGFESRDQDPCLISKLQPSEAKDKGTTSGGTLNIESPCGLRTGGVATI
jgi:hypothetical protein